jgi:hypothetical protein
MKTSVLISGIAALLLMITFAEAPLRRESYRVSKSQNDEIAFIQVNGMMPLAKTNKPTLKKEASPVTIAVIPADDYSYLKFDVSDYISSDATVEAENEMPESTVSDYSYLKFDVNEYMNNSEFTDSEAIELPSQPVSEFEYLRFDVNDYYTAGEIETIETGVNEFSYLKFDVNNFYNAKNTGSEYELPE